MKSLIAIVVGALSLAGCIAVPVGGYPEPAYGPAYYGAPAVSLGYTYYGGGYRNHRHYR